MSTHQPMRMISMSNFSWSYSHYSLALQCLRKFKYVVVDRMVPEGPTSSDLLFGSALHSAINATLTGQDGLSTFEIYWASYRDKEVEYGRYNWGQLAGLGANFIRKFVKMHVDRYKLVFAEQRLSANYKGVTLQGTPDFFGIYDGRPSLRDFKTSGRNYEQTRSETAIQLLLYAYLYKSNFPNAVIDTLGYTVFNKGTGSIQDLTWGFSEAKMYEALDNMVDYATFVQPSDGGLVPRYHNYPKNYNACHDYNRPCAFFDKCHKKETK